MRDLTLRIVPLPKWLDEGDLAGRAVAVFDVLRATTSMTAALAAGASGVRLFDSPGAVSGWVERQADRQRFVTAAEHKCLPVVGFDLGNSPGSFSADKVAGKEVLMATTNGTKALLATRVSPEPVRVLAACLNNASAVAKHLAATGSSVTLLCAGTDGDIALEDVLGAAAVAGQLAHQYGYKPMGDMVAMARDLFENWEADLEAALRMSVGGQNIINSGLSHDIEYAAKLDVTEVCPVLHLSQSDAFLTKI